MPMRMLLFTAMLMTLGTTLSMATDARSRPALVAATTNVDVQTNKGTEPPKAEEHGLSAKAVEIARPLNFRITNSMVVSWIVVLGLIVFAQFATPDMKQVP